MSQLIPPDPYKALSAAIPALQLVTDRHALKQALVDVMRQLHFQGIIYDVRPYAVQPPPPVIPEICSEDISSPQPEV